MLYKMVVLQKENEQVDTSMVYVNGIFHMLEDYQEKIK